MTNTLAAVNFQGIQGAANINAPSNVGALIGRVLPYFIGIAAFLLLIYLVMGGFEIMTAKGDPKVIAGAQAKITYAIVGIVVIILSVGIVTLLGKVLNVSIFSSLF